MNKDAGYKNDFESRQPGSLSVHGVVSPDAVNMYRLMEWGFDLHTNLCEVDDPITKAISNLKSYLSETMLDLPCCCGRGDGVQDLRGISWALWPYVR
ncbi:LOW QUALITY PROTEIN: Hypothetical protein PHPALM_14133 [Phytophthora palmivora]|uniref:Uncharacterized protein n=1 Tax=Phytophthora palmivora TaxID=4796 RepID=A0A2P4XVH3_9STRA|nr:LOW QUALITY PROTEIN: Hypothetical protein PHPALM_14133 [Phytophthora palmivora]